MWLFLVSLDFAFLLGLWGLYGMIYFQAVAWLLMLCFAICSGFALNAWAKEHGNYSKHRKYRTPYILGISLFVIAAGLIQYTIPKEKDPIAVSPSESELSNLFDPLPDKQLRGKIDISVYNRGDDPYYQIWVKLIIDSVYISADNIELDFPSLEKRIKDGEEPHAVVTEAYCLGGFDKKSHEAFLCFISGLDPKKTFQIKLTSNFKPANLPKNQIGRALIEVTHFEKQPGLRLENFPTDTKGSFSGGTVHHDFTMNKIIIFCPDIKQLLRSGQISILCTPNSQHQ